MAKIDFANGSELLIHLQATGSADVDNWSLTLDEHGVWLTNPYGIDCGLVGATEIGCQQALTTIASDTHEREWA